MENTGNRKKKALCVATVASNLDNFNRSNVELLQELGYEVTLAANFHAEEDSSPQEKIDAFAEEMREQGVNICQIDFSRHLSKIGQQIRSVRQVKELLRKEDFDLIHCHTPIASVLTRAIANKYRKKNGTRVLYTAHGFHFFKGAPRKNWLIYYPAEKWASRFTDVLITINEEDHELAQKKFHAGQVIRIPGIGADTEKFRKASIDLETRIQIRKELAIPENAVVLLSVGELSIRKNHQLAIQALAKLREMMSETEFQKLFYVICGQGDQRKNLEQLVKDLYLDYQVLMPGFRKDKEKIYAASDIFLFPSRQEGLPIALLEAMASGLPSVVTDIRGNHDLVRERVDGFLIKTDGETTESTFASRLETMIKDQSCRTEMGKSAETRAREFDTKIVREKMREIYGE